jgi:hypothetical protein
MPQAENPVRPNIQKPVPMPQPINGARGRTVRVDGMGAASWAEDLAESLNAGRGGPSSLGKELAHEYNHTGPRELFRRQELLTRLLGSIGDRVWVEPPYAWPTEATPT